MVEVNTNRQDFRLHPVVPVDRLQLIAGLIDHSEVDVSAGVFEVAGG